MLNRIFGCIKEHLLHCYWFALPSIRQTLKQVLTLLSKFTLYALLGFLSQLILFRYLVLNLQLGFFGVQYFGWARVWFILKNWQCHIRVESLNGLFDLGLCVLLMYLSEYVYILAHSLSYSIRICSIKLLIVLAQTDLLHSYNNVRTKHQVLHALHILSVHFHW